MEITHTATVVVLIVGAEVVIFVDKKSVMIVGVFVEVIVKVPAVVVPLIFQGGLMKGDMKLLIRVVLVTAYVVVDVMVLAFVADVMLSSEAVGDPDSLAVASSTVNISLVDDAAPSVGSSFIAEVLALASFVEGMLLVRSELSDDVNNGTSLVSEYPGEVSISLVDDAAPSVKSSAIVEVLALASFVEGMLLVRSELSANVDKGTSLVSSAYSGEVNISLVDDAAPSVGSSVIAEVLALASFVEGMLLVRSELSGDVCLRWHHLWKECCLFAPN
ncbi:unnamed protein product [Strongylus vulgaris]|uniref:Uncharacterized protein n=1 Tax=Strongylus vulgaris TaxID=40348 RepID=A0A3P7L5Z8_STRVU|nr:unnamed protein product [Strongylus vulgaris]